MQKLLRKQENWFRLWIQVANPFWQLEMLPTCSPWQRPEWPPAAIGDFGLGVFGSFSSQKLPRKHFNTTWIPSEIYRMTQREKSALRHFFTSSSNFWCIGVCGSSSAKRRTESSLAEKIATCSCLMGKLYYFIINNTYPVTTSWPFFSILMLTSEIHAPSFLVVMFGSHVPMGTEMQKG